jgi:hypothetical protein
MVEVTWQFMGKDFFRQLPLDKKDFIYNTAVRDRDGDRPQETVLASIDHITPQCHAKNRFPLSMRFFYPIRFLLQSCKPSAIHVYTFDSSRDKARCMTSRKTPLPDGKKRMLAGHRKEGLSRMWKEGGILLNENLIDRR